MLNSLEYRELSKIVDKANEFLYDAGNPEFHIIGVNWDDDDKQWCVSYQSDYGSHEFINVWVIRTHDGYRLAGHNYQPLYIKFF